MICLKIKLKLKQLKHLTSCKKLYFCILYSVSYEIEFLSSEFKKKDWNRQLISTKKDTRTVSFFVFYSLTISLALARARSMWLQMFCSPSRSLKLLRFSTSSTFGLTPDRTMVMPSF